MNSYSIHVKAFWTYRRRTWLRLKAFYLWTSICLVFAKLRYHLLCFKYFGWIRVAIFFLEFPEHFRSVLLALFSHDRYFFEKPNDRTKRRADGEPERSGKADPPEKPGPGNVGRVRLSELLDVLATWITWWFLTFRHNVCRIIVSHLAFIQSSLSII